MKLPFSGFLLVGIIALNAVADMQPARVQMLRGDHVIVTIQPLVEPLDCRSSDETVFLIRVNDDGSHTAALTAIGLGHAMVLCRGVDFGFAHGGNAGFPPFPVVGLVDVVCDIPAASFDFVTRKVRAGDRLTFAAPHMSGDPIVSYRWYIEENPTAVLGRSETVVVMVDRTMSLHVIASNDCASTNFYVARIVLDSSPPARRRSVQQ
ncbi:MAG TPA: hypothetical protein VF980_15425 [Thermoanaerobaculia bacterium]